MDEVDNEEVAGGGKSACWDYARANLVLTKLKRYCSGKYIQGVQGWILNSAIKAVVGLALVVSKQVKVILLEHLLARFPQNQVNTSRQYIA